MLSYSCPTVQCTEAAFRKRIILSELFLAVYSTTWHKILISIIVKCIEIMLIYSGYNHGKSSMCNPPLFKLQMIFVHQAATFGCISVYFNSNAVNQHLLNFLFLANSQDHTFSND